MTSAKATMTEETGLPDPGDRVCVGAVTGVRGLKGEVRIKSFTADPDGVAAYGPVATEDGGRAFEVRVVGRAKGQVVARLSGVDDREAAEALKGARLYVAKAKLPEPEADAYYHADLVGLRVETPAGESLGTVKAAHNFGAGDVIEIAPEGGVKGGLMVPFTKAVVPVVDLKARRMVVSPPAELETPPGDGRKTDEG